MQNQVVNPPSAACPAREASRNNLTPGERTMTKNTFESEWKSLKPKHFYYTDVSKSAKGMKDVITDHFSDEQNSEKYGVYVIRKKEGKNEEDAF
jgi:hypothetical protein